MTEDGDYLLDNQQAAAAARLNALAAIFDPSTFRHIDDLGITTGWTCWEVGAGGPTVPTWLAARVGPEGRVLATDIDVSLMADKTNESGAGYEVRRHDVGTDEPPAETFDLVHARLVLVHVTRRTDALRSMARALRPGGWLFVEDADPELQPLICPDEHAPEQTLANKLRRDFRTLLARRGADLGFGRTLPRLLRNAGLTDVAADAYFPLASPALAELERATVEQVHNLLVSQGLSTPEELDQHLANVASGQLDLATSPMISAWGRRRDVIA